jgi:hypothetical protein
LFTPAGLRSFEVELAALTSTASDLITPVAFQFLRHGYKNYSSKLILAQQTAPPPAPGVQMGNTGQQLVAGGAALGAIGVAVSTITGGATGSVAAQATATVLVGVGGGLVIVGVAMIIGGYLIYQCANKVN